jgi:6-phosphogluconate dehydrogenase
MPGGSYEAWDQVKPIFQAISAKVEDGSPCCEWVGEDGAGHYVKMVHNGIEYGDMQLITEAYHIMRSLLQMSADEICSVFDEWNKGKLDSYLIEITRNILKVKDTDGQPLVEKILDTAGQKGTGKWTAISALDLGISVTLIAESVFQRCISAMKNERIIASKELILNLQANESKFDRKTFVDDLMQALYASKIISYTQGFMLMKAAAKEYGWKLNYGGIALMWRGGCIIRSVFLGEIKKAFEKNPELSSLLLDPFFKQEILSSQSAWRKVVSKAIENGIPVPGLSSALAFFDSYRSENLPANLLQAQRDYFGAHTYERKDNPRGSFFHTEWIQESAKK